MKILPPLFVVMIAILQFQLWVGDDSVAALNGLKIELENQQQSNAQLDQRNRQLEIEVLDLKNGYEAVEERAREELGMIGDGETFYLLVD